MLTKNKILILSTVAALALSGCGDRGADTTGNNAPGAGTHYPDGQDTDHDGLTDNVEDPNGNGIVDPGETDRLNPDTDGDGLKDGDLKELEQSKVDPSIKNNLKSCEPVQPAGYRGYNNTNGMWQVDNCDTDDYLNGTEDNASLTPNNYLSDPYDANSACFLFKSKKYCEVATKDGKTYLDRNLGAKESCKVTNDANCYGDLYQWGRTQDGHELRGSSTQDLDPQNSDYNPVYKSTKFEIATGGSYDWLTAAGDEAKKGDQSIRSDYWKDHTTGEVCPEDWYVPSVAEANATIAAEHITNAATALASPLGIGKSGDKSNAGSVELEGTAGGYWTTDYGSDNTVRSVTVNDTDVKISSPYASSGFAVRCIKK